MVAIPCRAFISCVMMLFIINLYTWDEFVLILLYLQFQERYIDSEKKFRSTTAYIDCYCASEVPKARELVPLPRL